MALPSGGMITEGIYIASNQTQVKVFVKQKNHFF